MQYTFNIGVEGRIYHVSPAEELERIVSSVDAGGKVSLKKAANYLKMRLR